MTPVELLRRCRVELWATTADDGSTVIVAETRRLTGGDAVASGPTVSAALRLLGERARSGLLAATEQRLTEARRALGAAERDMATLRASPVQRPGSQPSRVDVAHPSP